MTSPEAEQQRPPGTAGRPPKSKSHRAGAACCSMSTCGIAVKAGGQAPPPRPADRPRRVARLPSRPGVAHVAAVARQRHCGRQRPAEKELTFRRTDPIGFGRARRPGSMWSDGCRRCDVVGLGAGEQLAEQLRERSCSSGTVPWSTMRPLVEHDRPVSQLQASSTAWRSGSSCDQPRPPRRSDGSRGSVRRIDRRGWHRPAPATRGLARRRPGQRDALPLARRTG